MRSCFTPSAAQSRADAGLLHTRVDKLSGFGGEVSLVAGLPTDPSALDSLAAGTTKGTPGLYPASFSLSCLDHSSVRRAPPRRKATPMPQSASAIHTGAMKGPE